jgi:DNA-directed RNA polymerase subunit K/omega
LTICHSLVLIIAGARTRWNQIARCRTVVLEVDGSIHTRCVELALEEKEEEETRVGQKRWK